MICPAPCAAQTSILKQVCDYLGIEVGETTPDGLFTVEAVKCLAACHRAPMFQVQGDGDIDYHENQTLETTIAWIEEVRTLKPCKEEAQRMSEAKAYPSSPPQIFPILTGWMFIARTAVLRRSTKPSPR